MGESRKQGSVLVVDDDDDIRETITLVLEDEGYAVACASNGEEALGHLRTRLGLSGLPDLILLDLMMPVMDGVEFLARQRLDPLLSGIPVVVITASGNTKELAAKLAAEALIQKPLALEVLLAAVARCKKQSMEHHIAELP